MSFLDPIIKLCKNVEIEDFHLSRLIFYLAYDLPVLLNIMSTIFYNFYCIEFVAVKEQKRNQSMGYTLWVSFVISFTILSFLLFYIFATGSHNDQFFGIYTYVYTLKLARQFL